MTLKAVRVIKDCDVITAPKTKNNNIAFDIIKNNIDVSGKEIVLFDFPMIKDKKITSENYVKIAKQIETFLDNSKNVAMLTLGDVSIYSTCGYILDIVKSDGYDIEVISGIPSFCSIAAKLKISLTSMERPIHIIVPLNDNLDESLMLEGTKIFMKAGNFIKQIKEKVINSKKHAFVVINCGFENEKVFESIEEINIEDKFEYFTTIVVKD